MNKRYSIRTVWQWLPTLLLLLTFTSVAHAATTITSFTSSPTTVAPGEEVFHTLSATTDAVEVLSGSASFTLSRDGSPVFSDTATDFLDQQDIGGGSFQDTRSFNPALYSTPGVYELLVQISGTEDFDVPVSDSATTTFTVAGPSVPTVVSPTSLSLSGTPGETVSGTFTVTDGESPFSLTALLGTLSQPSANVGESVSYSFLIPSDATPGSQLSDDITVTPVAGDPVIIPVSISVLEQTVQPITVSPPSLSLQGGAGETPTASFTITSGLPPFQLLSANSEDRGSFSNPTPGLNESVDYGFSIPGAATDNQVFTDTITVIGADGEQATVIATITAVVSAAGSTVVSPTSLSLSGNPGETVSGTFTVTDGESPFSLAALLGTLSQPSANVGESVSYSFLIPSDATPGSQLSDDITVTPVAGDPVIIPVSISVTEPGVQPITVSPPSLSLQGGAGETPTASFMITSGLPPFQLLSANPEDRGSFSNLTPGLNESVDYGFSIPGAATDNQVFTDTITVIGADGEQATVIATITAVGDSVSPVEGVLQEFTTTETQRATAAVIEIVCPSGAAAGTQFQNDCDAVIGAALSGDPAAGSQVAQALAQITTDQASASIDVSQTSIQGQIRNVGTRIAALRSGAVGFSSRGLSFNLDGQHIPAGDLADAMLKELQGARGGAAGSDNLLDFGRLGVFVNGSVSKADRDATANAAGFDSDTVSLTLGADYRFRDNMVAGAALGYSSSDTNIDSNGGSLDADGYSLSLYGTYYQDSGLYVDGIVTYGTSDYDQRRNIRYTLGSTAIDQTASADFDGSELSASLGGGYMISKGALSFGPTARIEYIRTEVDGFSEKMSNPTASGGGWATRIESQDFTSFTSQLGGQMSYAVSTSWGVLLPTAQLEWVHEFEDNAGNVVGHFVQDTSGTTFSLPTDDLDQNYFNLNLGVSAQFAQGRTGYVNFRKLFGYDDLDVYTVSAGVRLEF